MSDGARDMDYKLLLGDLERMRKEGKTKKSKGYNYDISAIFAHGFKVHEYQNPDTSNDVARAKIDKNGKVIEAYDCYGKIIPDYSDYNK